MEHQAVDQRRRDKARLARRLSNRPHRRASRVMPVATIPGGSGSTYGEAVRLRNANGLAGGRLAIAVPDTTC
jgi:hypothetical protein